MQEDNFGDNFVTKDKYVNFQRNGNSQLSQKVKLVKGIKFSNIFKEINESLQIQNAKQMRLFNFEGVEIYEDELEFLKNNSTLYVSKGEEFDQESKFSEYKNIKVLGQGGFGTVMLAKHLSTNQLVAIKTVNTNMIGNAMDIDMVFKEVQMLKSLNHKNIIKVLNCYTLEKMKVVFIMEFLEGGELLQYVQNKGRLTENEARTFFQQIVNGINYCHKNNVLHRDLKLENILLINQYSTDIKLFIQIIDFGIAGANCVINSEEVEIGSLHYLSPEAFSGNSTSIGPWTDVWAIGIILYAMVCGNLPFNGESSKDIIQQIKNCSYQFPPEVANDLSPELKHLFQQIFVADIKKRINIVKILNHPWTQKLPLSSILHSEDEEESQNEQNENKDKINDLIKNKAKNTQQKKYSKTTPHRASLQLPQNFNSMSISQKSDLIVKQNQMEMQRKSVANQQIKNQLSHSLSPQCIFLFIQQKFY